MKTQKGSATKQHGNAGAMKLAGATKLTSTARLLESVSGFGFLQMKSVMQWEEDIGL